MVRVEGLTLALDASTATGTVAVIRDGVLCAERSAAMRGEHEERLMPAVAAALADCGARPADLARVVCGAGPGSFTSLRIAAAIAKGISSAADIPLFSVSSLALGRREDGQTGRRDDGKTGRRAVVTLDAMRGEFFWAVFSDDEMIDAGSQVSGPRSLVQLEELAREYNADVVPAQPHARNVAGLLAQIVAAGPVDLAAWEPDYGRKAEAQVKWEAAHGRQLTTG